MSGSRHSRKVLRGARIAGLWVVTTALAVVSALVPSPAMAAEGFGPKTDYPTDSLPFGLTVADLDKDGNTDLVIANLSGSVSVLLGKEDGTFAAKTDYSVGSGSSPSVAVGDLDGDGDLDLVTANLNADSVSVLLGNGDGTFAPKTEYFAGQDASSVALGDLDSDGNLDVVAANRQDDDVSVLMGIGDGTFPTKTDYPVGDNPYSVAVGDLDGDGHLDVVSANLNDNSASVLTGSSGGTLSPKIDYPVGSGPISVATGDLDGNGDLDVLTANNGGDSVSALAGNGDGTLAMKTDYPVGDQPYSVAVGDLDGDGDLDVVIANRGDDDVSVLSGNGDGALGTRTDYPADDGTSTVAIGLFNTDGDADLAVTNVGANTVSVLLAIPTPDTTPPDTVFTGGPVQGASVNRNDVSFSFAGRPAADTDRFECKLDAGGWSACTSPVRYRKLANARHTVQVRAIDAAGNADTTPASRSFRVARNAFKVRKRSQQIAKNGKIRVVLVLPGPGKVKSTAKKGLIKKKVTKIKGSGIKKITLAPSKKGMKRLKKSRATRPGPGRLKIKVKWTYRPVGATSNNNKIRRYILKLK